MFISEGRQQRYGFRFFVCSPIPWLLHEPIDPGYLGNEQQRARPLCGIDVCKPYATNGKAYCRWNKINFENYRQTMDLVITEPRGFIGLGTVRKSSVFLNDLPGQIFHVAAPTYSDCVRCPLAKYRRPPIPPPPLPHFVKLFSVFDFRPLVSVFSRVSRVEFTDSTATP